jgi:hypothetical protein
MDYAYDDPMNGREPELPDPAGPGPAQPATIAAVGTLDAESGATGFVESEAGPPSAAMGDAAGSPNGSVHPGRPDPKPSFLAELAQAMQAAAGHERDRIATSVADDATAHIGRVKSRAAAETDELRRLAEQDVDQIAGWEETEIERVRATAARRTEERRERLERYIVRHAAIIDTEIDGVNGAVEGYRTVLGGFFDRLAGSNDPGEIARLASALPDPPDLDAVRAEARTAAIVRFADEDADDGEDDSEGPAPSGPDAETAGMVAVMDPAAQVPDQDAESPAATPVEERTGTPDAPTSEEATTPVAGQATTVARLLRTIAPWTVADERVDNGASSKPS